MSRLLKIGHRGAAGHAPENTLAAVEAGIKLGVDFVEIDVRRTHDGALVAIHDSTVNRTTDGKGRVAALSLRQLKSLDAGNGERIPTIEEVLERAAGRAGVMLELKVPDIAELTVQAVHKTEFSDAVIYASFLHGQLWRVRTVAPDASIMVLFNRLPQTPVADALRYRPTYVGIRHDRTTRRLIEAFHSENIDVCVYTANSPEQIKRALSFGADGMISDFPDRIATP